ncbi:unnamed protein product, partial [Ectocarpus sp. 12 AP-2014]
MCSLSLSLSLSLFLLEFVSSSCVIMLSLSTRRNPTAAGARKPSNPPFTYSSFVGGGWESKFKPSAGPHHTSGSSALSPPGNNNL